MKIGIDVTAALTQGGGIGRYTREMVTALTAVAPDIDYHFFTAKPVAPPPVARPLPQTPRTQLHMAPLNERWLYRLWYRARLPLPVQWVTGPIDLFHSPDFVLPPVHGRIPTLLTVHDLSFVHYPTAYPERLVRYLNQVVPWSIHRASHVLADSQATKTDLVHIWDIAPDKVTVLYSGVSHQFQPVTDAHKQTAVRQKYQIGPHPYILSVGTVQPRKNYQMLIQAFQPIAQTNPHQLIISGGKGWLYEEMMAEVSRQGLDGRVRFIGFVDDDDLPTLYSSAELFAFPTLYEGFGLPLLEAMQCGVPVICSDVSSLPEVVGLAAIQLPPHDVAAWTAVMQRLLHTPSERAALVAAGFRQARLFSWQQAAQQLSQLYQTLCL